MHAYAHVPFEHDPNAFAGLAQTLPQRPQFARSVASVAQTVPHTTCPDGHESWQVPEPHTCPEGQTVPQRPQLLRSLVRSRHVPEQSV